MILTKTPYRVSLFGGGTDYPKFFKHHGGGAVLGMAIDQFCYVGVKRMPPGQEIRPGEPLRYRVQYSKVDDCQSVEEIKHPAVRAALRYYGIRDERLEFHIFGDLAGRSGLGGSSSFVVGLVHALRRLGRHGGMGSIFDAWKICDDAIYIEQEVIGEAVGCQDQVFAAHGGMNYVTFAEDGGRSLWPIKIPEERLQELCYSLVLVFTGSMRDAHVMAEKQIAEIPQKTEVLAQMRHQAMQAADIIRNQRRSLDLLGPMLAEAWGLKKEIHPEITDSKIDALYELGLKCGATGGKLLGAGGGGFMLFYVPHTQRDRFENVMIKLGREWVPVNVSHEGTQAIITED